MTGTPVIYSCCKPERRTNVLGDPALNGIDFLEVLDHDAIALDSPRQRTLLVHCLKAAPAGLTPDNVLIDGGASIVGIPIQWIGVASPPPAQANAKEAAYFKALPDAPNVLVVRTAISGDFSTYNFRLVEKASLAKSDPFQVTEVLTGFDPQLASVCFSFKVECPPDFDCAPEPPDCIVPPATPPPINYLAKDYGSFRQVMLDRLSQLLPTWGASDEADMGVTLAELVSYVGDNLSYQQDAIATEAYLQTARSRISLRRHALLVDYHVHDGCNARAWIQVRVAGNPGDQIFLDRTLARFYTSVPGMPASLAVGSNNEEAALIAGVVAFEPMADAVLFPEHDQISFYTWGDTDCCLPQGSIEATLFGAFPNLKPGDVLIFQEMKGPETGDSADADVRHRCAVRLTHMALLTDPLYDATGKPITSPGQTPAPITEIQWGQEDALPFPVCISSSFLASDGTTQQVTDVSLVFGNIVLADQGLTMTGINIGTVPSPTIPIPKDPAADRCQLTAPAYLPVRFNPIVPDSPLTEAVPLTTMVLPAVGNPVAPVPLRFGSSGLVNLVDVSGFTALTLRVTNPASWPSYFGVLVAANAVHPANIDLSVVFNPPGGAAGLNKQITVEAFPDLSLNSADANFAVTVVNAASQLIRLAPASPMPALPLPGLPAAPTMLPNVGTVNLLDSAAVAYLVAQPTDPSNWMQLLGVTAQAAPFDIQVVYDSPAGGVGVALPVTVELFSNLSLTTVSGAINGKSVLVEAAGLAQTADSSLSATAIMNFDATLGVASISMSGTINSATKTWSCKPDLLESLPGDTVFVVEVESNQTAVLRFGDDTNGKRPDPGTVFVATYRVGNGTPGNVGPDSLVNLAAGDARIQGCRNPMPATGGTDPETNDQIRRRAPQAFLTQERAITMADYEAVAESNTLVDKAVANLRWTGSWYTVFIAVEPQGGGLLSPSLAKAVKKKVNSYRLAGQDLQLSSPQYVSLEIELEVCVDPGYFRSDVQKSLLDVLSNRILPNGQKGLFFPDNFTFGQTVYLSPVYAAARSVAGVISVTATKFQIQGVDTSVYLTAGELKLGSLQIARLDNDRNFPDHGQLTLVMEGGK